MEERAKAESQKVEERGRAASDLGKFKCPYTLDSKPGRQGQEGPAPVWARSSAHA